MADTVGAAQLAITADATGVETGVSKAKKTLATLGGAAKTAGAEASKGVDQIGKSSEQAAQKMDRDTKRMEARLRSLLIAAEAGGRNTAKAFELTAIQKGNIDQLRPLIQQLEAYEKKSAAAALASRAVAPAITQVGLASKQMSFALRQVPQQFTDIATSIAAGQPPLMVLLQQGGQLKDMFGGIGPAARALGGYMLGLINPITLAAAAVATLGLAYFQGSKEGDNFAKAVILSGNAAGMTVGQLQQMAERISDVTGTQAAAAAALAEVVQSGQIAGNQIERFTTIALKMERETGQAVAETVKQFVELGKSPVDASTKLNEATNFLTASVARQIRILEEQGRVADAARLAQETYAGVLESRLGSITQRLGYVERAWRAITGVAKDAWDAMLNVGRPDTLQDKISQLQDRIQAQTRELNDARGQMPREALARGLEKLKGQLNLLTEQERLERRISGDRAQAAAQTKARIEFDKQGEQHLTKQARMEREILEARNLGLKAGASQAEIDKRVLDIRKKYEEKGSSRAAARLGRAELGLDIERIRGESEQLLAIYSSSERRIETLRQAGLLSDREYYESKRAFINLESQAKEDALQKELARLQAEKLTGAEKLQNDKKIADATAKLAIQRADTSAKLEDLSLRQQQATRAEAAEFLAAQQAAESYFGTIARRQEFELSGFGRGRRQRDIERGRFDINERFSGERERLESRRAQQELAGTFNEDERRRFDQRIALLEQQQQRELALYEYGVERRTRLEQDWTLGAQEALRNYADAAGNVAAQVDDFFGSTFNNLEDVLAKFAQTGKLSFSDLVRSILADIARLQARRLTGALANALSGAISGLFGGGGAVNSFDDGSMNAILMGNRAVGGPVSAGRMYEVNERGRPELLNVGGKQFLMMGNQSGTVKPGGGGIHIVNNTRGRIDEVHERTTPDGERVLILEQAVELVAAHIGNPNSRISKALSKNTTAGRRRS